MLKEVARVARVVLRPALERRQIMLMAASIDSTNEGKRRVVADYKRLHDLKGITIDEYYDFEFEKRCEDFRKSFLGLNEQRFYLDYLNPVKYYSLARNKYLAHKMLEGLGIRKTQLFCYYQPEARYMENDECAHDMMGVLRLLKKKGVSKCVIKTTESSHGDNVWVIDTIEYGDSDAVMTRFDGRIVKLSELLGLDALIFEGIVEQTDQFSAFNKSSVNTVRFMTTLYPDGSARVIATFLKIGRAGKCVDNAGEGGNVDVCVDIETGMLKYAIQYNGRRDILEIEKHPDSGNQLNGVRVDNWQPICEEVKRFQQAFPYCKAAGWDIAITDEGPVVIEVNDFWDRVGQYFIRRGWRDEVRDCYLAWRCYWESDKTQNVLFRPEGREYRMYRQPNSLKQEQLIRIASHE